MKNILPKISIYDKFNKKYLISNNSDLDIMYSDGKWYWNGGDEIDSSRYDITIKENPKRRKSKKPVSSSINVCGLTEEEQNVMNKLMECYDLFIKMDKEHPDEMRNFIDGVHRIQEVLAMRTTRRTYPEGWPTYNCRGK